MMIDWLSLRLCLPYYAATGMMIELSADGDEVRRVNLPINVLAEDDAHHPSWSSTIRIIPGSELRISGNFAKFLQGHNVYGPESPRDLFLKLMEKIAPVLGLADEYKRCLVYVTRIDVTCSFVLPASISPFSATNWIARHGFVRDRGRGLSKGNAVAFGKTTGRSKTIIYDKGRELKKHPPSAKALLELEQYPEVERLLRVEVRFLRKYMDAHGLQSLEGWSELECAQRWQLEMDKLHVNNGKALELHPADKRGRLRGLITQWQAHELPPMSRPSLYRNRARIRELYGVDILAEPTSDEPSNVVEWSTFLNYQSRWRPARPGGETGHVFRLQRAAQGGR